MIRCDNAALVSVLSTGKTRNLFFAAMARNVWLELTKADIQSVYKHLQRKANLVVDDFVQMEKYGVANG